MQNSTDILIAEDDKGVAGVIISAIQDISPSSKVQHFSSGLLASNFIHEHRPRSIILDLMLPGKDGVTLLKEIRRHPNVCETPVVVMTGIWEHDIEMECRALGVLEFVKKPDGFEDLERIVRRLVMCVVRDILGRSLVAMKDFHRKEAVNA